MELLRQLHLLSVETLCLKVTSQLYRLLGVDAVEDRHLALRASTYKSNVSKTNPKPPAGYVVGAFSDVFNLDNVASMMWDPLDIDTAANIASGGIFDSTIIDKAEWGKNFWINYEDIKMIYDAAGLPFPDIGIDRAYRYRQMRANGLISERSIATLARHVGLHHHYPALYLGVLSPEAKCLIRGAISFPSSWMPLSPSDDIQDLMQVVRSNMQRTITFFEAIDAGVRPELKDAYTEAQKKIEELLQPFTLEALLRK